jgi:hypothetical protein
MTVAVPASWVARLRRLAAEPTTDTYTDLDLTEYLERYPLDDAAGYAPTDTGWAGAWDINLAAADVWDEKAAVVAANFDFAADGGDYKRSQPYAQALTAARMFRTRRQTSTLTLIAEPKPLGAVRLDGWIGNLAESDE